MNFSTAFQNYDSLFQYQIRKPNTYVGLKTKQKTSKHTTQQLTTKYKTNKQTKERKKTTETELENGDSFSIQMLRFLNNTISYCIMGID